MSAAFVHGNPETTAVWEPLPASRPTPPTSTSVARAWPAVPGEQVHGRGEDLPACLLNLPGAGERPGLRPAPRGGVQAVLRGLWPRAAGSAAVRGVPRTRRRLLDERTGRCPRAGHRSSD